MNSKGSLSQSQPLCTDCKKAIGHVYCTGCDAHFCVKHYGDHRLVLDEQMKQIASTQKSVQERIDSAGLDATTTEELIEQISHWEKENAAKIQRTADQARSDVLRLSDAYRAQVLREFEQFSNELNDLQETQNYVEPVLQARQTQVEQFQKEVYKLSPFAAVVIDAERCHQIDWNALVTVNSLVTTSETRQPTGKSYPEDERAVTEYPEEDDRSRQRSEETNRRYSGEENGRESMSVDTGLTDRISQRIINTIPASNDRNAGTVCCHDNQLMYVIFDERSKSSQIIFLHNIAQPDEKLIIDWTPPTDSRKSFLNEDWIRDITYCDRLKSFLLLTETSVHTWNDDDDRFKEFHRLANRQLKRVTTDRNLLYLVAKSNQAATRYDTIITLNYDKAETTKSFADIVGNPNRTAATAVDYDITDIAAAPYNHLMVTYRGESQADVGVHLFAVGSLGREWIPLKQFQLDDCWHKLIDYTPRVEWANQLTAFVLTEYNSGHLLMINEEGQIKGECQFQHQDGRSQSPINVSISAEGWVCTRYSSAIVVKKVE